MKAFAAITSALVMPLLATGLPAGPGQHQQHQQRTPRITERAGEISARAPELTFHPAANPNGAGVLVVPGGGYSNVAVDGEGAQTISWLNSRGYHAWQLVYSTSETAPTPLYPKPQQEALDAVRQIRGEDRVAKLGIWGFSAGGHLAAMTLTEPGVELDFGILAYPVITMDAAQTHMGSRDNLIGKNPSADLVAKTSAEKRVTASTPPVFIFHTANDPVVPVENAVWFAAALTSKDVPFSQLILPDGNHGLALALQDPQRSWTGELDRWMKYSI